MRRVAFFQPRTEAKANYANGSGDEQTWTPWFACYLSPAARAAGLDPSLIDARVHDDWRARVAALGPDDILAVSVMTGAAIVDALDASRTVRANGGYVIWGGPHVTLFPAQTLAQSPAHAVIPGFGFDGFRDHVFELATGALPPGGGAAVVLTERDSSGLVRIPTVPRASLRSAADTVPDLDLVRDWEPYINADIAIAPRTVNYVTSEGCLRRCTFCSEPQTSGGAWYLRPVEESVTTIARMVSRAGADGVKFHDPNFFQDDTRSRAFAALFAREVALPWAASLHPADLLAMPDDMLELLSGSGLSRVLMGLESPVPELAKMAGKHYDTAKIPAMAARLAEFGVRGMFTFIVGWPDAEPDHYERTVEAAFRIRDVWHEHQCKIHFLEPWPGTPIYRLLQRRGFPYPDSLEDWARVDYYQAQYAGLHDFRYTDYIRHANTQLSPYVEA